MKEPFPQHTLPFPGGARPRATPTGHKGHVDSSGEVAALRLQPPHSLQVPEGREEGVSRVLRGPPGARAGGLAPKALGPALPKPGRGLGKSLSLSPNYCPMSGVKMFPALRSSSHSSGSGSSQWARGTPGGLGKGDTHWMLTHFMSWAPRA